MDARGMKGMKRFEDGVIRDRGMRDGRVRMKTTQRGGERREG